MKEEKNVIWHRPCTWSYQAHWSNATHRLLLNRGHCGQMRTVQYHNKYWGVVFRQKANWIFPSNGQHTLQMYRQCLWECACAFVLMSASDWTQNSPETVSFCQRVSVSPPFPSHFSALMKPRDTCWIFSPKPKHLTSADTVPHQFTPARASHTASKIRFCVLSERIVSAVREGRSCVVGERRQ